MTRRARRGFHFESRSRGRFVGNQRDRFAPKKVPAPAEDGAPALIATRLVAPPVRGMIDRPRLAPFSPARMDGRLWLIRAPAGFGKSVLAAQWFASMHDEGHAAAWITARPDMNRAADFARYIEAALDPDDCANRPDSAQASPRPDHLLSRLVALLAAKAPVILFIDGADQLGATAASLLADLLLEAPASTRLVLTMRREPSFTCGWMRTRKALIEIDAQALRFSDDEAAALFASSDTIAVTQHASDMEGWPAGLALRAQHPPRATMAIDAYLEEEVFSPLSEDLQRWLCAVSILDRFSSDLCDAMTDGRKGAFPALRLEGLCIESSDDPERWLRLHPALAEHLQRRLAASDRGCLRDLHLRASRWFAAHDDPVLAIRHAARSEDHQWLASLLEAECESLALDGRIDMVDHHAQQIPASIRLLHPRLTAALAWLKTRSLRLDESKRLLASAKQRVAELHGRGELTPPRHHELQLHCLHQELMCAVAEGDIRRIDALSRRLLAEPEGRKPFMLYSALTQSLAVRRETYDLAGIEGLVADAQAALRRDGYRTAHITIASAAGSALFACGKVNQAIAALKQGIDQSGSDGLGSIAALPLSDILYQRDELVAAQDLVDRYLPFARGFGFLDHLAPGHIVRGRLARLSQGPRAALELLEESLGFARMAGLKRLQLELGVEIARYHLEMGSRQQAMDVAAELGFAEENARSYRPGQDSTRSGEIKAIGWFALHGGSTDQYEALRLASDWARFGSARGAPSTSIRWQLNLAWLHVQKGETERATRSIWAALKIAAPIGLVRLFLDQVPAVHELLRRIAGTRSPAPQPVNDFVLRIGERLPGSSIRNAATPPGAELSGGAFSEREIEVLSLAGLGASNAEIGTRLGLTEGTVKWHLQQIYDKLGVRRRSQAVLVVRAAGLIT